LPDCGGGTCVPESAIPPADCEQFDDEQGCSASGCSWSNVAPVLDDAESYACGMTVGICLWFPQGEGGDDVLTPYMRLGGPTASIPAGGAVFGASFDAPALGWIPCGSPRPQSDVCPWWSDGPAC
jgi:hypothetical protein